MPEVHTANSIPNIPLCSTLVTMEAKDVFLFQIIVKQSK
jgi:hypothetical protein